MTMVCETVTGATMGEIRARRDAVTEADLVEVRLDGARDPDAAAAVAGARRPVLVTCRPSWEGGAWDGGEPARERLLLEALDAGAAFVDVEWRAPGRTRLLLAAGSRAVLSLHDFAGVPPDLEATAHAMAACRPGIVKLAVRAHRVCDVLPLLPIGAAFGRDVRLALIAMGTPGILTRVAAARFGASVVYGGPGVAPGQLPVSMLLHGYRVRRVSAETALLGILGRPIGHSVSPAMHNAAFEATGIDAVYVPLEAASWEDFDEVARRLDIRAASVTSPFKGEAWRACARRDALSEAAGAVNTVRRGSDDAWEGCNTDVEGFLEPLRPHLRAGVRVTVVGAGGAARAVVTGLSREPVTVTVRSRRAAAAAAVAEAGGAHAGALPVPPGSWDVLVNATPVGTWPGEGATPVEAEALTGRVVYDLVYNPADTALLRAARASGCETIGGLAMLVAQGARQFTWWTGHDAPVARMRAAAEAALADFRDQQGAARA